jgi:hypothetical protein
MAQPVRFGLVMKVSVTDLLIANCPYTQNIDYETILVDNFN